MMNWKVFGRKCSWRNFKALSQDSLGETEEIREKT
jgi:hypothetical protein